jgi:hypothetical protein
MKKFLLSLTLMLATVAAWAEGGFYVVTTSGDRTYYLFEDEPVLTFEGDNLVITCLGDAVIYPMSDLELMQFDEDQHATKLTEIKNAELVRFAGDGVELSGFAAYTTVTIYNLQGQLVGTYRTDESGSLNISLADREQGFNIIKANKSTLKIKK